MKKQILILLLKYGLGIGVLVWLIWSNWHLERDGREEGLSAIVDKPFNIPFLLLSFVFCLAGLLLTFVRWFVLVRAQDLPFDLGNAIRLGFIGSFMNTFLPGSVGGDIVKAAFIAREQTRRTVAVSTVLVDRLIGLCGLFWIAAILGGVFWSTGQLPELARTETATTLLETILWGAGILTAASIVVWAIMGFLPVRWIEVFGNWLSRLPKIGGTLRELWNAVWMYRRKSASVALAMALAMVGHLCFFMTFYSASRTVSTPEEVPALRAHFLLVPVGATIEAGFPAPGGMGGGEFGFGLLYEAMDYQRSNGVWASLMRRTVMSLLAFLGYLLFLRSPSRRVSTTNSEEVTDAPSESQNSPSAATQ